MPLTDNIIGITVGIRYAKSFRIPDISGDVIDNILYGSESPFSKEFFPRVQENSAREKTLFNPNTDEYLRLNTDDLIIGISVRGNFEEKFNWVKEEVLGYFQNTLFTKFNIKNIRRLGIIYAHKVSKDNRFTKLVSSLTNNSITSAEKINVSFSQKSAATEALIRKKVNDYQNTIYNFAEMENALQAQLDYQYYYEPVIEDLRECFTDKILSDSRNYLENNYYSWLDDYAEKN